MPSTTSNIYEAVFAGQNDAAIAAIDLGKGSDPVTYARLQAHVNSARTASAIKAGDKVALVMPNSLELIVGLLAAWAQGAATAPLNPAYTSVEFRVSQAEMQRS